MIPSNSSRLVLILLAAGAAWGMTQPLTKIAVSADHGHYGLIFWQMAIGAAALALVCITTKRSLPMTKPALWVYLVLALIGSVIPSIASYQALEHLPSGVHSVLISLVPMVAFPIALALGNEVFENRRLFGLLVGLAGVLVLILPKSSLPDPSVIPWVGVSLIAILCYGFEGNYVARWGLGGVDAIQALFGASVLGALLSLPFALATDQFISPFRNYGAAEYALILSSFMHVAAYVTYVWLVGKAGSIFAAQVGYSVTAFGIIWAMVLLGETYSPYFWAAAALILAGVAIVQPRT